MVSLSSNERRVLALLAEDGRMSASKLGRGLGLTSQAVGKIIKRLEDNDVITGYSADINYKAIGLNVFALAFFRFKSGSWNKYETKDILERVRGPHIIRIYRLIEGDITHVVVYGFRDIEELNHYFQILQTERGHISELVKVHILSADNILKNSPAELIQKVLSELDNPIKARPLPPDISRQWDW